MAVPRGRFVWYDLMTTNVEAAKAFYAAVVGWNTRAWEGSGSMPYTMWMAGETPVGGVMALSDAMRAGQVPSHWMAYVAVPDVDGTARETQALCGTVVVPAFDITGVGRVVIATDPQGAAFAAFTPAGAASGHDGPARRLEFSWHELSTTDSAAALAFYSKLFGWEPGGEHDMGPMGIYRTYGRPGDGFPLGGMMNAPPQQPVPAWCYYVRVDDVQAGADRAKSHGGQVLHGPIAVPGGDWIVVLMDPQGAVFALHHTKKT